MSPPLLIVPTVAEGTASKSWFGTASPRYGLPECLRIGEMQRPTNRVRTAAAVGDDVAEYRVAGRGRGHLEIDGIPIDLRIVVCVVFVDDVVNTSARRGRALDILRNRMVSNQARQAGRAVDDHRT